MRRLTRTSALLLIAAAGLMLRLAGTDARAQNAAASTKPTLFLLGDSTVRNGTAGQQGWGDFLAAHFDPAKITVVNRAIGGRSSRTFQTEGRWDRILAELKPGDFVLMQFGHNDGGPLNDATRARGTLKGTGEETQEIDNLLTKKREVVHTYGWYLRKFIADAKAKGATPIVLSPVPRNIWKENKVARAANDYGRWAREAAQATGAAFVDLNEIIALKYEALGLEKVQALFGGDHTHTNPAGAELNAQAVVEGLKALPGVPLARYLSAKTTAAPAENPFAKWEAEIAAYEQKDRAEPPAEGGLLFIGSSTIRLWNTLAADFAGHHVLNRGFGGSQIVDSTHFADRIIFPYEPRAIFLRAGGNDLHEKKTPEQVFADFQDFVTKIHARLPATSIAFIALSPSIARWNEAEQTRTLNWLVRVYARRTPRVIYVEADDITLGPDGKPRPELFVADKLHFSAEGYKLLAERVRPHLPK